MISSASNLLEGLRSGTPPLSRAEQKIAQIVLARPEAIIRSTLADLAAEAQVSEPTVIRFCRALGCEGFQDFKVSLAQSVAADFTYTAIDITPSDAADVYATKVFRATLDTLVRVHQHLDFAALDEAVAAITKARKLEFYGLGASGAVAMDAYHKFFRLIGSCAAYTDSHMQYMTASTLTPDDVVVAISHTGRTKELLESATLARQSGATVVAITASVSPLAKLATILLPVNVPEDTDVHTPMISRIAHLLIIDSLAVGVATKGGHAIAGRLHRMKDSLKLKRTPKAS